MVRERDDWEKAYESVKDELQKVMDISADQLIEHAHEKLRSAKLIEALKYYANEANWYDVNNDDADSPVLRMVIGSVDTDGMDWIGGHKARKALAEYVSISPDTSKSVISNDMKDSPTESKRFTPEDFDWVLPEVGSTSFRVKLADFVNHKLNSTIESGEK